jgi:hypothetical protein
VYEEGTAGERPLQKKREKVLTTARWIVNFLIPNKTRITAVTLPRRQHDVADCYLFAGNALQWLTSTAFQR